MMLRMANTDEALRIAESALEALSYIHDGNPSDAMAGMDPLEYARHILWSARQEARQALRDMDAAMRA